MFGLNNGIIKSVRSMPRKDLTSDNSSTFATPRRAYTAMFSSTLVTNDEMLTKKWFGNKDASSVTAINRIHEIGLGSLNGSSVPMAFKNISDPNTRKQALTRARHP